jgi:hypothetical protein
MSQDERRVVVLTERQIMYLLFSLVEKEEHAVITPTEQNDLLNRLYGAKYDFERRRTA